MYNDKVYKTTISSQPEMGEATTQQGFMKEHRSTQPT
jgi:hypothetical protein